MKKLVDIAPRSFMALILGYPPRDLTTLEFNNVNKPVYPLDKEFEWTPAETT